MPKKKSDTPEKEEVVLTEWQKRNLEFLKNAKKMKKNKNVLTKNYA